MKTETTLTERIARLSQRDGEAPASKLDDLKKSEPPKKGTWGGKRVGAGGSKPRSEKRAIQRGIKAWIDEYVNGEVAVQIVDPKTGKSRIVKKPRVVRVLEMLYDIGVKDRSPDALNKWLDRALGKPVHPVAGDEDAPIMIQIKPY